ncbi:low affinity iron permease family protein [Flaviflagellibacter deserti]|uniref:Low affinity iron permease family protein n=1 Tax=Flaviflagellibacter deserti TaxID=2267266 RepID=A0ABV9Z3C9_9HYPH
MTFPWLTQIGTFFARPTAFLIVIVYAILWLVFERETFDWHGVATLATWMMTLFIQRSEHRDTQALQAKIDELLRVQAGADTRLSRLDNEEPEEVERFREEEQP